MTGVDCSTFEGLAALAALGRLDDASDKLALEAHLEGCPTCRLGARQLDEAARLLDLVDRERIFSSEAMPGDAGQRILDSLRSLDVGGASEFDRGRRRRLVGLVAAGTAALAAAAVVTVVVLAHGPEPGGGVRTFALDGAGGMHASAVLTPEPWGTSIRLAVGPGRQPGVMWVYMGTGTGSSRTQTAASGKRSTSPWLAGSFVASPHRSDVVSLSCGLSADRVEWIWVEDASGRKVLNGYAG